MMRINVPNAPQGPPLEVGERPQRPQTHTPCANARLRAAAPVDAPWMWTLAFGHHEDRTPTHGYAATREGAMTAFAKSWRRK
jgi:hypothetical protein